MPLFVVTGASGAGKSSSAIEDFVIGDGFDEFPLGLRSGQHVVTDIEGMKDEARQGKLRELVAKSAGRDVPFEFDAYGSSELSREGFWPRYLGEDDAGVKQFDFEGCAVRRGSMIVVDEAEIFRQDKMPKAWIEHINYHRHWGSEDFPFVIVLMYQNYKPLHEAIKSNALYAYEYVHYSDDAKRKRFGLKNPGDIPKIPRTGKGTLDQVLPRNLGVRETYVTTVASGKVAKDNFAVSPWKALWRKHRKLILGLFAVGIPATIWAYWHIYNSFVAEPKAASAASRAAAASTSSAGVGSAAPIAPHVVGVVPTARGGVYAIVAVGDEFRTIPAAPGRPIIFEGRKLEWPADF